MDKTKEKKVSKGIFSGCLGCFGLVVLVVVLIGACSNGADDNKKDISKNKTEVPKYKIVEENFNNAGIWYVSLETPTTNEKELKSLVEYTSTLAEDKKEEVTAIFVKVFKMDNPSKMTMANGKVALSDKGKIQTGLDAINKYEFEYKVSEEHSKEVAKSKQEGPTAKEVLRAFEDKGLSVPEPRENEHQCLDLECVTLMTTEAVSIYEWPTVEKAKEVQGKKFGTHQYKNIIIRMNDDTLDAQSYIDALESIK